MPTRRTFVTLAAAAAALFATPAFAVGSLVDVQLVDRARNDPLPSYAARGSTWVAGQPGSRFAVRLSNHSGGRVLVVLSVDGVNAISGETAAVGQTGYVLEPWQTAEITGWRKNLSEAAAFYFTALPDSYAARTDRPDNVGVIGTAVFRERYREPEPQAQLQLRDRAAAESRADAGSPASPSAAAKAAAPQRLGTGHGEKEYSPTTQVEFERATERPAELVRLRYDSRANLIASGVIRVPRHLPAGEPDPFPAGFVPDPKG